MEYPISSSFWFDRPTPFPINDIIIIHSMRYFLLTLTLVLTACGSHKSDNQPTQKDPITIGAIVPLTGGATTYGFPIQKALNLRVEQVNAAGGINGRMLEIEWEDGKCNGADAALAAEKLINADGVEVIIGGVCSGETLGAAPIAEAAKVVLITPISKSPAIADAGDFVFRLNVNSKTFGSVGGGGFSDLFESISSVTQQTDFAIGTEQGLQNEFLGAFKSNQFPSETSDFRPLLEGAKSQSPDALLVAVQTLDKADAIWLALGQMDWTPTLIVNELIAGSPAQTEALADYKGDVWSVLHVPPANPERDAFVAGYEAEYGEKASYGDAMTFAVDAIDLVGSALFDAENGTEIKDILATTRDYNGFAGTYSFDANGEATITPVVVQLVDGVFTPVTE